MSSEKEMARNVQEAYRTPNRLDQKRKSSHNIIFKTLKAKNKENIKCCEGKMSSNMQRQTEQNHTRTSQQRHQMPEEPGQRSCRH